MNIFVVIGVLLIWILFDIILKLANKKNADYSFIVTFAFVMGLGYYYFYDKLESKEFELYSYALIGTFIFILIVKVLISVMKKDISKEDFMKLEREILDIKKNADLLQKRFVSTIEILNDGMCFKDCDEDLFGTDRFIELFGLKNNIFSQEVFESKIYKDDLIEYKKIIEKITKKKPIYSTTYRVNNDGNLIWIKEVGKKIFLDKKESYISIVKPMNIKQFPESEIDVLNELPNHKKLYEEIQNLVRIKKPFTLILMHLTNVPNINEKYGRDLGDLMMGEYLKKMRYNFIKDNHSLYRVGGINFALIIKDERKVELIDRALQHGGDLFNLKMVFGGVTQTLYPNLGLSQSPAVGKNADQIIDEATEALKITLKESFDANYHYYENKEISK